MRSIKFILFAAFLFGSSMTFAQLKGKAKHLPGKWAYQEGSGYEIWEEKNGDLVGAGYRMNKIGDTVHVETLGIKEVNKQLFYTIETGTMPNGAYTVYKKYQFVSPKRKLKFVNIEKGIPVEIDYSFGFFNKNKMIISIYMADNVKRTKLVLRRQS